ncbi:SLAM family member 6 isoform X2 [Grammomys surdaster]|uniref:SLAM family member 6 isoform X2 n=1 Tax=Grammomys surdaster TaxID=491861 RepID=UPI00109F4091|nr:SLAM family member 6 isoform X2 [Grammomys surdaster]
MAVSRAPAPDSAHQRMVWLFPLVFCLGSGSEVSQGSSDPQLINGILGESVVLPLELPAGKTASVIVWSYEREASHVTTILIIHLNEPERPLIINSDRKKERRLSITQSYSLQLNNLTLADTGSYTAQVTTEDTEPTIFRYTLKVFERLSNLEIANHTLLLENGTCQIHLVCIVKNPNQTVSIDWQATGNIFLGEPNVTISWDPRNSGDQTYICRAENAVSNLSVSVSTQSLCEDVLTNPHWNTVWFKIIISIIIAIIVLIFVCVGICVWKRRRGSLPLTSQHPDSSQNTDTPGSPGNTVYAQVTRPMQELKIPKPIKNDSMTIYSIVNHSREPVSPRLNTLKDVKLLKDFKEIQVEHIY